jgi:hypothetical protein
LGLSSPIVNIASHLKSLPSFTDRADMLRQRLGALFINSVLKLPKAESGQEQRSRPHHAKFCFPSAMPYFSVVFSNAFLLLKVLGEIDSCDDFFLSCHITKCFPAQQPLRFAAIPKMVGRIR